MNEKKIKFYTKPYWIAIFIIGIIFVLIFNIFIILWRKPFYGMDWKTYLALIDSLLLFSFIMNIHDKCFNFIEFSSEGMFHKNGIYDWDSIHITAFVKSKSGMQPNKNIVRVPYYFAFSDHYLSYEEISEAYKKGLCISINEKRLEYFLDKYKRKIYIHDWAKLKFLRQLTEKIEQHNKHIEMNRGEGEESLG